jgi:RNA recognition motif-containing protein
MKIFVKNLDESVSSNDLMQAAEKFGEVETLNIVNDVKTGKSMGIAYIEMSTREESLTAIEGLNGLEIKGKKISAQEASSEPVKKDLQGSHGKPSQGSSSFPGKKGGGFKGTNFKGGGGAARGR